MNLYKVDIIPLSNFRDFPSSYTIFGAICWGYSLLFGENNLEKLLKNFEKNNPSFLVSSIFPKYENNYLFPKPNLKSVRKDKAEEDYKKLKKISYIDLELLEEVLENKVTDEYELNSRLREKTYLFQIKNFKKDIIPHASIDRVSTATEGAGQLYFEEIVSLNNGYFLIAIKDENIKKQLEAVFEVLQDIGIGGNRSIGYGKVRFGKLEPFKEIEKYFHNKTDKFITLSPIIPEANTYNLKDSYYEYFTFRGAIDNNYNFKNVDVWKRKVIYLKDGSCLKTKTQKSTYGSFYKTKTINGKNIYQYGLAFPLYIQGGN